MEQQKKNNNRARKKVSPKGFQKPNIIFGQTKKKPKAWEKRLKLHLKGYLNRKTNKNKKKLKLKNNGTKNKIKNGIKINKIRNDKNPKK